MGMKFVFAFVGKVEIVQVTPLWRTFVSSS